MDPGLAQPGHELLKGGPHEAWIVALGRVAAPVHAVQGPVLHQRNVGGHLCSEASSGLHIAVAAPVTLHAMQSITSALLAASSVACKN